MQKTDELLIQKCRKYIESQLSWGEVSNWTNEDFESLSERIQLKTGTCLSITTLKRIWGKVKYESRPTMTTLNTLARFIDFENWRAFVQAESGLMDSLTSTKQEIHTSTRAGWIPKTFPVTYFGLLFSLIAGSLLIYFFSSLKTSTPKANPDQFKFSSRKIVSSGVPNSVVFDYDASGARPADSIFIQQSWDQRLSQLVSPREKQHTSIYYYPGFFQAKLVVNHEIVKEHNLLIQTDGWLPLVEQTPVPVYFTEQEAVHDGMLQLPLENLLDKNIPLQPVAPWVDYYYVNKFPGLTCDNFSFETEVKNDYNEGSAICQQTRIMLLTEGSVISLPLSAKGCISDLNMYFIDHAVDGKKDDLSGFGCNLSDWVKVRCDVNEKKATIFVNDTLAFQTTFAADATEITGIVYRFQGSGSVRYVRLMNADRNTVYENLFK